MEERTGMGGGFDERGQVEYKHHDSDSDEYDDFGRKKKKFRGHGASSSAAPPPPVKSKHREEEQDEEDDEEEEEDDDGDLVRIDLRMPIRDCENEFLPLF